MRRSAWVWVVALVALTIVSYLPVLDSKKEFTNWDDNIYVTELPLVHSLKADSVAKMFDMSTSVASNYHPLTLLSLAANYEMFGPSARGFAATNVVLHILNALLVFLLVRRLTSDNILIAGLTSLWFAIHPMHVESVAWVSERKDVLYTLFLLLSMLSYIRYVTTRSYVWLAGCFIAFVASCLSKAMAVPLPFALLLVDYWYDRKLSVQTMVEKIPFLAVAVWLGLVALEFQSAQAIAKYEVLTTAQRLAFAGYGFVMYWVKMIVPVDLSAFYPYPTTKATGNVSWWYFVMPVIALAMLLAPYMLLRNKAIARKYFVLSMGIYVLFVALVLQFISVGQVIMAERYSYVPYIGALLLLAYGASELYAVRPAMARVVIAMFTLALVPLTYVHVKTWKNSETLWTRVIDLYPYEFSQSGNTVTVTKVGAALAYGSRAQDYYNRSEYDKAFEDMRVLELVNARGLKFRQALGVIYGMKGEYEKSQQCLTVALEESPNDPGLLYNRAISFAFANKPREAIADFQAALRNGVQGENRYQSLNGIARESLSLNDFATCAQAAEQAVLEQPGRYEGYFTLGTALVNLGRARDAAVTLTKGLEINPSDKNGWFNLAVAYRNAGDPLNARKAAARAKELGANVPSEWL